MLWGEDKPIVLVDLYAKGDNALLISSEDTSLVPWMGVEGKRQILQGKNKYIYLSKNISELPMIKHDINNNSYEQDNDE